jgi:hypothetical protein
MNMRFIILNNKMAELLLAAGAAYLGLRAARRVRSAYNNAIDEMYEKQRLADYYHHSQQYENRYDDNYHHSNRYHSDYLYSYS